MLRLTLSFACLCAAARAEVLVLDAAGGGDFTTVQQVVDGTADGDIVIVRPGDYESPLHYPGATFGGKSLTILADGTGPVDFPAMRITNIPAGKTFVLRGVRIVNDFLSADEPFRLTVDGCQGLVLVEDCLVEADEDGVGTDPSWALNIVAANLALESCQIVGTDGLDEVATEFPGPGNWGLRALVAHIALSNCTLTGGAGGDELSATGGHDAGAGGPALFAEGSTITLSGCTLVGGSGGHSAGISSGGAPAGGAALYADATSVVWLRDTTATGGAGGTDASGIDGPAGADIAATGVVQFPGPARTLHLDAPLVEGGSGQLSVAGQPGELAALLVSFDGVWLGVPKFGGTLLVGAPAYAPWVLGPLDASGGLQLGFVVPDLGLAADAGSSVLLQLITSTGTGVVLGGASATVLLGGP